MSALRIGHTATLLQDGRVLIAGGMVPTETGGLMVLRTAELYDPASGTFVTAANMTVPRIFHTATLLSNGKVLIAGWEGSAELFDPAANSFTATAGAPAVRFNATATSLTDGRVLIAGGEGINYDVFYVGSSELYDPNVRTIYIYRELDDATLESYGHTAARWNGLDRWRLRCELRPHNCD
jgi:hypothetical protein